MKNSFSYVGDITAERILNTFGTITMVRHPKSEKAANPTSMIQDRVRIPTKLGDQQMDSMRDQLRGGAAHGLNMVAATPTVRTQEIARQVSGRQDVLVLDYFGFSLECKNIDNLMFEHRLYQPVGRYLSDDDGEQVLQFGRDGLAQLVFAGEELGLKRGRALFGCHANATTVIWMMGNVLADAGVKGAEELALFALSYRMPEAGAIVIELSNAELSFQTYVPKVTP